MACSVKLLSMSAPSSVGSLAADTMLGHISASSLGSILMCDDPALPTAGTHFGTAHFGVDKYEPSA